MISNATAADIEEERGASHNASTQKAKIGAAKTVETLSSNLVNNEVQRNASKDTVSYNGKDRSEASHSTTVESQHLWTEEQSHIDDAFEDIPNQSSSLHVMQSVDSILTTSKVHVPSTDCVLLHIPELPPNPQIHIPPSKTESLLGDFDDRRRIASKEVGSRMAQGWILLNNGCPKCATPLMADPSGITEICVLCGFAKEGQDEVATHSTVHTDYSSYRSKKKREAVDPVTNESIRGESSAAKVGVEDDGSGHNLSRASNARAMWSSVAKRNLTRNDPPAVQGYALRRRQALDCDPETRNRSKRSPDATAVRLNTKEKDPSDNWREPVAARRRDPESSSELKMYLSKEPEPSIGNCGSLSAPDSHSSGYSEMEPTERDVEGQIAERSIVITELQTASKSMDNEHLGEEAEDHLKEELVAKQCDSDDASDVAVSQDQQEQVQISVVGKLKMGKVQKLHPSAVEEEGSPLSAAAVRHESGDILVEGADEDEVFTLAIPGGFDVNNEVALRQLIAVARRGIPLNVDTDVEHHNEEHLQRVIASPGLSVARAPQLLSSSGTETSRPSEKFIDGNQSPISSSSTSRSKSRSRIAPENIARSRRSAKMSKKPASTNRVSPAVGFTPEEPCSIRSSSNMKSQYVLKPSSASVETQSIRSSSGLHGTLTSSSNIRVRTVPSTHVSGIIRSPSPVIETTRSQASPSNRDAQSSVLSPVLDEANSARSTSTNDWNSYDGDEERHTSSYQSLNSPNAVEASSTFSSPYLSRFHGLSHSFHKASSSTNETCGSSATPIYVFENEHREGRQQYRIEQGDADSSPETIVILDEGIEEEEPDLVTTTSDHDDDDDDDDENNNSESVTSEAIDSLLDRIEETQAQLAAAGKEEDSEAKRVKLTELLDRLSDAAAAMEELDDNSTACTTDD